MKADQPSLSRKEATLAKTAPGTTAEIDGTMQLVFMTDDNRRCPLPLSYSNTQVAAA